MLATLRQVLNRLPRRTKSLLLVAFDAFGLLATLFVSYQLRLGPGYAPTLAQWALVGMAPVVAIPIFLRLGLYRAVIRYLPERALWTILWAMGLATLAWVFLLFFAEATRFTVLPRSVPLFYFVVGSIVIAGSRFAAKALLYPAGTAQPREILIYGAGESGRQLAAALAGPNGGGSVAGFLDDDPNLQGRDVSGIRVHPFSRVRALIEDHGVREVILSMPSLDTTRRQAIYAELSNLPVTVRALPSLREIAAGRYQINALREIDIDDLLGRSSVPPDTELLERMITGRVILVSGGGGSIGSELCRVIARFDPKQLVILESNEHALYQIERSLQGVARSGPVAVLGSVTDAGLLQRLFATHPVDVVFHAAAHKHVPLVEANPLEGARNNIIGTATLAAAAFEAGVRDFVLISTDKAVRPTSVMGATKRWAELIVGAYGAKAAEAGAGQRFCAVRFGNVLGSNGSVVPLFREQIAAGGPVTLTDERMTRYFMSIHEAAELIVQAGALSTGGDIFLLEMGEPVRIRELAENMIRLAGLSLRSMANPGGDIEIVTTGIRPAEKLTEELFYDVGMAQPTRQPKILHAAMGSGMAHAAIDAALVELTAALDRQDEAGLRHVLFRIVAD